MDTCYLLITYVSNLDVFRATIKALKAKPFDIARTDGLAWRPFFLAFPSCNLHFKVAAGTPQDPGQRLSDSMISAIILCSPDSCRL